jgi:hypothetical protein
MLTPTPTSVEIDHPSAFALVLNAIVIVARNKIIENVFNSLMVVSPVTV